MSSAAPLPQGAGYAVVLGLGFAFALFMNGIIWIQQKFSILSLNSASEFSSANRSLKSGLVVARIISSWTWSLTLLRSATQSYVMGVSGGYWYAVGGTLQIAIFAVIASKVKMNANRATTFPENLGWLIYFLGVSTTSGAFPISLTFLYIFNNLPLLKMQKENIIFNHFSWNPILPLKLCTFSPAFSRTQSLTHMLIIVINGRMVSTYCTCSP